MSILTLAFRINLRALNKIPYIGINLLIIFFCLIPFCFHFRKQDIYIYISLLHRWIRNSKMSSYFAFKTSYRFSWNHSNLSFVSSTNFMLMEHVDSGVGYNKFCQIEFDWKPSNWSKFWVGIGEKTCKLLNYHCVKYSNFT